MIHIIDYGAGNLFSVQNALNYLQIENKITANPADLADADGIILPGVGAFRDAMTMLNESGFTEAIKVQASAGKPILGICLGMQMLFEKGYEFGETDGLGLIPGNVVLIDGGGLKIPHMGWNDLTVLNDCPLSADVADGDYVYYVHSYRADTSDEYISCYTMYNEKIPGLVYRDNVYGAQFHPEKSGQVGMNILKNFAKLVSV
ncbi:MAG: imidazole glycerol phosphate synthase subunit HisH [Peptococcaceae bacterium]|jgi:glutamine amidotransferase|nr:imidazole glycerol phosphate synthase subunit HisH [Peptococcaceae bacterium]MBQ2004427.1 imidazole glycerol phosphate synthase subunit HisH [Peptococcaceae bacterium]MBQ2021418.1 imidazole glycerol phosphate synthase subunit HisH [Peptococcaceae bacterium]MBQ2432122.1 imidazole glycerol phosphate synthase subunit HisH [Peptococcaceae bacterium]MBQ5368746.1 imidazole glycerol phosphate synthase subunit HisH [Peptococcaceae bacterium]